VAGVDLNAALNPAIAGDLYQSTTTPGIWARTFPALSLPLASLAKLDALGNLIVEIPSEHVDSSDNGWLASLDAASGQLNWLEQADLRSQPAGVDSAGNVIVDNGSTLEKLAPDGSLTWSKPIPGSAPHSALTVDGDGNVVLAEQQSFVDGTAELVLQKLDPDGNSAWLSTDQGFAGGIAFMTTGSGGSVAMLAIDDHGGGAEALPTLTLSEFDATGALVFTSSMDAYLPNQSVLGQSAPLSIDAGGNVRVLVAAHPGLVGSGSVDLGLGPIACSAQIVAEFGPDGRLVRNDCLLADSLAPLPSGGFVAVSTLNHEPSVGGVNRDPKDPGDGLITRYDASVRELSTTLTPEPGFQDFNGVIVDAQGAVYVTGFFWGELSLPGDLKLTPVAQSIDSYFVARLGP
jgi:hypothetical protein